MAKRFFYSGDVNLEYGGYFYNLTDAKSFGYADVIRVIPFSDCGGQDNGFWIEIITVNIPANDGEMKKALDYIGQDITGMPDTDAIHVKIAACMSYGYYEIESSTSIQIGADDPFASKHIEPMKRIKGNWKLKNYVKKHYLQNS